MKPLLKDPFVASVCASLSPRKEEGPRSTQALIGRRKKSGWLSRSGGLAGPRLAFVLAALLVLDWRPARANGPPKKVELRLERVARTDSGHAVASVRVINHSRRHLEFIAVECTLLEANRAVIKCTNLVRNVPSGGNALLEVGVLDAPAFDSATCRVLAIRPARLD